jgi:5'-3' exoribonuclease 1
MERMRSETGATTSSPATASTISESMLRVARTIKDAFIAKHKQAVTLLIDNNRPVVEFLVDLAKNQLDCHVEIDDDIITITNCIDDYEDGEAVKAVDRVLSRYEKCAVIPDTQFAAQSNQEHAKWKQSYYESKVGKGVDVGEMTRQYALGLQWIIHYYYEGVQSWSWYYPYHYAPHLSDLAHTMLTLSHQPCFEMGEPLRPLEQLMAVLPPASGTLLPACLHELMRSRELSDLYPSTFGVDQNGKSNAWEAIVLIPFIDEARLLEAVASRMDFLTERERMVNQFGPAKSFEYLGGGSRILLPSPSPDHFPSIDGCQCRITQYTLPSVPAHAISGFWTGAVQGVDRCLPGFPSLFAPAIAHTASLEMIGVAVFQGQTSGNKSLLLTVAESRKHTDSLERGRMVLVDWPFLKLAIVEEPHVAGSKELHSKLASRLLTQKAIRIHQSDPVVGVRLFLGTGYDLGSGRVERRFDNALTHYPRSLTVSDPDMVKVFVGEVEREEMMTVSTMFPVGGEAVVLCAPYYGCMATILANDGDLIEVSLLQPSPPVTSAIDVTMALQQEQSQSQYYSLQSVAREARLSPFLVSKLFSSFIVFDDLDGTTGTSTAQQQRHELGLCIKFEGRGLVQPGYCRRSAAPPHPLEYSREALNLLLAYHTAFPPLFDALQRLVNEPRLVLSMVLPGLSRQLARQHVATVKKWLKERGVGVKALVGEASVIGGRAVCENVEREIDSRKRRHPTKHHQTLLLPARALLTVHTAATLPPPPTPPALGARMRYLGPTSDPFGALATCTGVIRDSTDCVVELVLDEALPGVAGDLQGRCGKHRGVVVERQLLFDVNDQYLRVEGVVVAGVAGNATGTGTGTGTRRQYSSKTIKERVSVQSLFNSNGTSSSNGTNTTATTTATASTTNTTSAPSTSIIELLKRASISKRPPQQQQQQ